MTQNQAQQSSEAGAQLLLIYTTGDIDKEKLSSEVLFKKL